MRFPLKPGANRSTHLDVSTISSEPALGVDFGTYDSKAVLVVEGRLRLVVDAGRAHVPSVVVVPPQGPFEIGRAGPSRAESDPECTITSIKRLLGRPFSDPQVRVFDQGVGYRIVEGPGDQVLLRVKGNDYSPLQIAAAILTRLRELAELSVGRPITRATLSVPVDTAPGYAGALKRAAELAGLANTRFVHEPVAAAWGARLTCTGQERRVLVCDFGGGTFDCSLLLQSRAGLQVVGAAGDPFLGGDDLDSSLAEAVAGQLFRTERVDLHRDVVKWAELVHRAEGAKRKLSAENETMLLMPMAYSKGGVARDLNIRLSRIAAEGHWKPLVDRAIETTARALEAARWPVQVLDELLLVGGTSLVPMVRREFTRRLSKQPAALVSSDVVVATGLALMDQALQGTERDPARIGSGCADVTTRING